MAAQRSSVVVSGFNPVSNEPRHSPPAGKASCGSSELTKVLTQSPDTESRWPAKKPDAMDDQFDDDDYSSDEEESPVNAVLVPEPRCAAGLGWGGDAIAGGRLCFAQRPWSKTASSPPHNLSST
jgi:hypothetical protein